MVRRNPLGKPVVRASAWAPRVVEAQVCDELAGQGNVGRVDVDCRHGPGRADLSARSWIDPAGPHPRSSARPPGPRPA